MPLLDHFHPPLSRERHSGSFLSCWTTTITGQLNLGTLPTTFFAEPRTNWKAPSVGDFWAEPDIPWRIEGGVVGYTPAPPSLTVAVDLAIPDLYEVQIRQEEEEGRVVAAVELVAPRNKGQRSHREEFLVRCAGYLRRGVSVLIVDIVTEPAGNLHAELLEFLGVSARAGPQSPDDLYAVAYRSTEVAKSVRLEVWAEKLALGAPLPTLPIWLLNALPLDLEQSYRAACDGLRIHLPK
jgi:hypothetical protein